MEKVILEILQIIQPLVHTHPFWPGHLTPREDTLARIEQLIADVEELVQHGHGDVSELPTTIVNPLILTKSETQND